MAQGNFYLRQVVDVPIPQIEVMDIGASALDGESRYTILVHQGVARVTGFEPDETQFRILQEKKDPRYVYFPYFLGDGGKATFHIAAYPGCSSLYEADPAMIDLFQGIGASTGGNFTVVRTCEVDTKKLDDIADVPPPDFIKLDIQGGELNVLKNATKALESAMVIEIETEFVPLYKNQPLFGDIQVLLREHGFVLHKMLDMAGRCFKPLLNNGNPYLPMSQLLWADSVFVKDFTKMDRYSPDQLLKTATILNDVYNSNDLALFFLNHYDKQTGSFFRRRYTTAMADGKMKPMFLNIRTH
ncbi:MAG: FkbM family methyltransferase [Alphaproteobacteria bacterium]|nr:FkbM family methyltransferase [Alphaproteobacteria bacterium]